MEHTTVQQLKSRLDAGEKLNVIDVREPEEYHLDNINALLFPLSKLRNFDTDEIEDLKNKEVIVHCRSGKRSIEACLILEQMGFSNTVNVSGGILEWREKFGQENLVND